MSRHGHLDVTKAWLRDRFKPNKLAKSQRWREGESGAPLDPPHHRGNRIKGRAMLLRIALNGSGGELNSFQHYDVGDDARTIAIALINKLIKDWVTLRDGDTITITEVE
jgi:hypothetical protein